MFTGLSSTHEGGQESGGYWARKNGHTGPSTTTNGGGGKVRPLSTRPTPPENPGKVELRRDPGSNSLPVPGKLCA